MIDLAWLDTTLCVRLTLTLGHFLWEGLVIAVVALSAVAISRRASARVRYGVFVGALLLMAACPPVTFYVLGRAGPAAVASEGRATGEPVVDVHAPSGQPGIGAVPLDQEVEAASLEVFSAGDLRSDTVAADAGNGVAWRLWALLTTLAYMVGTTAMLGRLALGLVGGERLRQRSGALDDANVMAMLTRQAESLALRLTPTVALCTDVVVPTVIGVLRPTILLPVSMASGLSPEHLEGILAHELAHIRRYDHVVNLVQRLIEALLFFHPAVWWISGRVRVERERSCDDLVVASGAEPLPYAASLLAVAEFGRTSAVEKEVEPAVALGMVGQRSDFRNRVRRILEGRCHESVRLKRPWTTLICVTALLAVGGLLYVNISARAQPTSDSTPGQREANDSGLAWARTVEGVRLGAAALAPTQPLGGKVVIRYALENRGKRSIRFYGGPSCGIRRAVSWFGGWVTIVGPDGKPMGVTKAAPYPSGGIDVKPNQTCQGQLDLTDYFTFSRPGRYRVVLALKPHPSNDRKGDREFLVSSGEFPLTLTAVAPTFGYDVELRFGDPKAGDGSFHDAQSVAFVTNFGRLDAVPTTAVFAHLVLGQETCGLRLEGERLTISEGRTGQRIGAETWPADARWFDQVITLPLKYGTGNVSIPVHLSLSRRDDGPPIGSYWFCAYLAGRLPWGAGGRTFEIVNLDQQMEFRNGKEAVLGIDTNGDGAIDPSPDGGERFALYEPFAIGDATYRITEVDPYLPRVVFRQVDASRPQATGDASLAVEVSLTVRGKKMDFPCRVCLLEGHQGRSRREARRIERSEDATYRFSDLAAGEYTIEAYFWDSYPTHYEPIRLAAGEEKVVHIDSKTDEIARIRVEGLVLDSRNGKPVEGLRLHFVGAPDDDAFTDEDGRFAASGDRARFHQAYLLRGDSSDRVYWPRMDNHMTEALARNLEFHVDAWSPVVRVRDEDQDGVFCSGPNCVICTEREDKREDAAGRNTDAAPAEEAEAENPTDALSRGSVSGVVVDAATGQPIPGAYVAIDHSGDAGGTNLERFREQGIYVTTETDAQGRFKLEEVAFLDTHPLMVTHPGHIRHHEIIALREDEPRIGVQVALRKGATIEIDAVDAAGNPLKGETWFRLEAKAGAIFTPMREDWPVTSTRTEKVKDGRCAFGELPVGAYSIDVMQMNHPWKEQAAKMRGKSLEEIQEVVSSVTTEVVYHAGLEQVMVEAGETKELRLPPERHRSEMTIHISEDPYLDPEQGFVAFYVGRRPGRLLWVTNRFMHPEDHRLGRACLNNLLETFFLPRQPCRLKNFPPGDYALFAGTLGRYPDAKSPGVFLRGTKVEIREGLEKTVTIPWHEPEGPSHAVPGALSALNTTVSTESRSYSIPELCSLLTSKTGSRAEFSAAPTLRERSVTLSQSEVSIWELLERLNLDQALDLEVREHRFTLTEMK